MLSVNVSKHTYAESIVNTRAAFVWLTPSLLFGGNLSSGVLCVWVCVLCACVCYVSLSQFQCFACFRSSRRDGLTGKHLFACGTMPTIIKYNMQKEWKRVYIREEIEFKTRKMPYKPCFSSTQWQRSQRAHDVEYTFFGIAAMKLRLCVCVYPRARAIRTEPPLHCQRIKLTLIMHIIVLEHFSSILMWGIRLKPILLPTHIDSLTSHVYKWHIVVATTGYWHYLFFLFHHFLAILLALSHLYYSFEPRSC